MLAQITDNHRIALPDAVAVNLSQARFCDVSSENGRIVLTPWCLADGAARERIPETIATAQEWLAKSDREFDRERPLVGSRCLWGAANLAIEAGRHTRGLRHGNYNDKALFVAELNTIDRPQPDLTAGLQNVKDRLHNHFYTNRLSAMEAAHWLMAGRNLVEHLLRIVENDAIQDGAG